MKILSEKLGPLPERSPFQRGYDRGFALEPGPAFPRGNSTWEQRLYARGWSRGVDDRRSSWRAVALKERNEQEKQPANKN